MYLIKEMEPTVYMSDGDEFVAFIPVGTAEAEPIIRLIKD